jgi:hypothetical protein
VGYEGVWGSLPPSWPVAIFARARARRSRPQQRIRAPGASASRRASPSARCASSRAPARGRGRCGGPASVAQQWRECAACRRAARAVAAPAAAQRACARALCGRRRRTRGGRRAASFAPNDAAGCRPCQEGSAAPPRVAAAAPRAPPASPWLAAARRRRPARHGRALATRCAALAGPIFPHSGLFGPTPQSTDAFASSLSPQALGVGLWPPRVGKTR